MFDENGTFTPEALLIINDSAFLAEMAYENREKVKGSIFKSRRKRWWNNYNPKPGDLITKNLEFHIEIPKGAGDDIVGEF